MKKLIVMVLVGTLFISTVGMSFASETESYEEMSFDAKYQTVSDFSSKLRKEGTDKAVWTASASAKAGITSMSGTAKLINSNGTTVKSANVTFKKGAKFTAKKTFTMPKKGKYYVKYSIKTYKSGNYQETISGKTGPVTRN